MYKRKTQDHYYVQGNFGNGWEDVCECDDLDDLIRTVKDYRQNENRYPFRKSIRREKIDNGTDTRR